MDLRRYSIDSSIRVKRAALSLVPKRIELSLRHAYSTALGRAESEASHLPELVGDARRAIDVGANHGLYTYRLSRLCEKVEAFEPQPWCADTIAAHRAPNVTVHEVALSDETGVLPLAVPMIDGRLRTGIAHVGDAAEDEFQVEVGVRRLDDFGWGDVSFIKIDVEGHEDAVLRGGRETLARCRPVMLVEIEQRHLGGASVSERIEEVESYGYEGYFLLDDAWHPVEEFSYEVHQASYDDMAPAEGFVNNFVFRPRDDGV